MSNEGQTFEFKSLTKYHGQPESEVIVKTNAATLSEIIESFESFLRGSGFVFDGKLDVVDEQPFCYGDCGDCCPDHHEDELDCEPEEL